MIEIRYKNMMNFVFDDMKSIRPIFDVKQVARTEEQRTAEEEKRVNHM